MEGRVIKFNLVGAICILILVISVIVGIITFAIKGIKNKDNKANQQTAIDEEQIYTEKLYINNQEKQVKMKTCKGSFGYTMNYDIEGFYVEKNVDGIDMFKSLYSDSVYVNVIEKMDSYKEKSQLLLEYKLKPSNVSDNEYQVTAIDLNGIPAIMEKQKMLDGISYTYYIKKEDSSYYLIQAHCGFQFEESLMPTMLKMIETFQIL